MALQWNGEGNSLVLQVYHFALANVPATLSIAFFRVSVSMYAANIKSEFSRSLVDFSCVAFNFARAADVGSLYLSFLLMTSRSIIDYCCELDGLIIIHYVASRSAVC